MHWISIGLIFIAVIHLALAIFVFYINPKNKINITFALGALALSAWVLLTSLFREASTVDMAVLMNQLKIMAGLLVVFFFQLFTVFFPFQSKKIKIVPAILLVVPVIGLLIAIPLFPGYITDIVVKSGNNSVEVDKFFWAIYSFFFTLYLVLGLSRLFLKLKESAGFLRVQLLALIIGFLIPGFLAWIFNIVLLFFDIFIFDSIGAYLSIIFSIVVVYFVFFGGKKIYIR